MPYLIFQNLNNVDGSLYKIAESTSDLDKLNIEKSLYKILEISIDNFENIKLTKKICNKFQNEIPLITDLPYTHSLNKEDIVKYITNFKNLIKNFTDNNPNHSDYTKWNNYYNFLNNFNVNNITYPLNISFEEYLKNNNQTYLNPLQIP